MKTRISLTIIICLLVHFFSLAFNRQFSSVWQNMVNPVTATFKVQGKCMQCKKTIERAAAEKGRSRGIWDEKTGMLQLTYDSKKTNPDLILKKVALSGHTNERYVSGIFPGPAPSCCSPTKCGRSEACFRSENSEIVFYPDQGRSITNNRFGFSEVIFPNSSRN